MALTLSVFTIIGWLTGVIINHLANVLPLKETPFQRPFCKRRLNFTGQEFVSTAKKGDDAAETPVYCRAPQPPSAWSGLLAYLLGKQHCSACGKSMSLRLPAIEVLTPLLFVFLYNRFGLSPHLFFALLYTAILLLLTVTDLEHRLIQNVVILPSLLLAFAGGFYAPNFSWKQAVLGGAIGFVVFYILALLARGGLGSGDVTLAAFLGLITGFPNIILVIVYGMLLGGIISGVLLITRRATMKTFIPYGPFLIVAGWVVLVWGEALGKMVWA